jgi:hypothetical protein
MNNDKNNNCNIKLEEHEIENLNRERIIKLLLERDSLKCIIKNNWYEGIINFLPTYKRNEKSKELTLYKKEEGRLPGYADRIIFNDNNISSNYKSLRVNGNDHFPIAGKYSIKSQPFPSNKNINSETSICNVIEKKTSGGYKSVKKRKCKNNNVKKTKKMKQRIQKNKKNKNNKNNKNK